MVIISDTREQKPYKFNRWDIEVKTTTLSTGDYSLLGFEDKAAIERKSLDDLVSCLMGKSRIRFENELARGRGFELFCVVVEANLFQIGQKQYHSVMNPEAVLQSIIAFHIRYGVPFLFAGNREQGEYMTFSLLQKFLHEIEKRFEQAKEMLR